MQWKHPSSPALKKANVISSTGKVMASILEMQKAVFIDYIQKGHTINGEFNAKLLRQLWKAIKIKHSGKLPIEVLFHQDNILPHNSLVSIAAMHDGGFELVDYSPYSSDLALSTAVPQ